MQFSFCLCDYLRVLKIPYEMSAMENRDEVLQTLERFTRLKQKEVPRELEDYLTFVARTGDTVYPWPAVKYFFRTKLSLVITDFHDNTPSIADLPQCPNVDPFCYDRMRRTLLSRMDSFNSAPFTIQRICELLNEPRKHYTRIDKFMRAVEKNILVVSTQEPGRRRSDSENNDSLDSIVNGDLEVNVDIEMDNEAFGIESNEIVTNAETAATETEPVVAPMSTPAVTEDVPPMESSAEQEKETVNHEPEVVPEVSLTDGEVREVNEVQTEKVLPKQVEESDKEVSKTEEESSNQTEKLCSGEVEPTSPEVCDLDSKEEAAPDVVDSAATDALDQDEPVKAPAEESHDTGEPTVTEPPPNAIAATVHNDPTDDEEPKAKMAKLSQDQSESETAATVTSVEKSDPEKDTTSSESTTDSNGSADFIDGNNSPNERSETGIVLPSSSIESIASSFDVSSTERSGGDSIVISSVSDTSLSDSSAVVCAELNSAPPVESGNKPVELEQSAEQTTDKPLVPEQTSEAPSEQSPAAEQCKAQENEETLVKRINLEENPLSTNGSEEQALAPERLSADDMETAIPENVMATDEEEQSQPGAVDVAVPMAADANETTKSDENAMDIDESSVEPMDQ